MLTYVGYSAFICFAPYIWMFMPSDYLGTLLKQHNVTSTTIHCFEERTLTIHVHTSHKTSILVKSSHILHRKRPLVFPLMSYDCSVCLQPLILAQLSPAATWCGTCSFGLQAASMLLSGTSMNHRVELEQS